MISPSRGAGLAFAADVVCIIAFVSVGRRNHAEGVTLAGIAETAWPFVTGAVIGWLISRGWRRPTAPAPTGVAVWICTVVVGMALRVATGEGIAPSFILVTTLVTGILMVGWRAVRTGLVRRAG